MPSITITWDATLDQRTCPICRALHGYKWTFKTPEPMPDTLTHPQFGEVWNVAIGSQAHGHQRFNCRCRIQSQLDVSDVRDKLEQIKNDLEEHSLE